MTDIILEGKLERDGYKDRRDIKKIVIRGESEIPYRCFKGCTRLETVILDEKVSEIGYSAFEDCRSLKEVIIEGSAGQRSYITVYANAFKHCWELEDNGFISRISYFGAHCFYGCTKLKKIHLGSGVKKIEASAFSSACFKEFTIEKANKKYYINEDFLIEKGQDEFGKYFKALKYLGRSEKCVIPKEVTMLSNMCFKDRSTDEWITEIWLPAGLTTLEDNVFNDDNFNMPEIVADEPDVYIQDKISDRVSDVFDVCHGVRAFHVSKGNPVYSTIKGVLYSKDHKVLVKVPPAYNGGFIVPRGVNVIAARAFAGCTNCFTLALNDSIEMIGFGAFANSSIYSIVCPDGGKAFTSGDGLYIRDDSPGNGDGLVELVFYDRMARHVKLLNQPLVIREYAFQRCGELKDVDLIYATNGAEIPEIMEYAFENCGSLRSVVMPKGTSCVPNNCFEFCTLLKKIVLSENINVICNDFLKNCSRDLTIVINTKRKHIYTDDYAFRGFDENITFEVSSKEFEAEGYSDIFNNASHSRYAVSGEAKKRYSEYMGFLLEKGEAQGYKLLRAPSDTKTFIDNFNDISIVEVTSNAFTGCEDLQYARFSNTVKIFARDALETCCKLKFLRVPADILIKYTDYDRDERKEKEYIEPVSMTEFVRIYSHIKSLDFVLMGTKLIPMK